MLVEKKSCESQVNQMEQYEVLAEDKVRKAFGSDRNTPVMEVLMTGFINPAVTYELACGKVPHTEDDFFAVNISDYRPGSGLDNWLMSGVFWTMQDALSYIRDLKSGDVDLLRACVGSRLPLPKYDL